MSIRLLICALLISCGGQAKSVAPAPESSGAAVMPSDPHRQIDELEAKIDADRNQLLLPEPNPLPETSATPMTPPPIEGASCRPANKDTCKSSCTLSDSICKNAEKICNLAAQLPGDGWATKKCVRANKVCDDSHKKCCGCQ